MEFFITLHLFCDSRQKIIPVNQAEITVSIISFLLVVQADQKTYTKDQSDFVHKLNIFKSTNQFIYFGNIIRGKIVLRLLIKRYKTEIYYQIEQLFSLFSIRLIL